MYFLKKNKLHNLLKMWNTLMKVYTPIKNFNEIDLLPYDEKLYTENYINFILPVKEYIFKPKEKLFKWERKIDSSIKIIQYKKNIKKEKKIFFGIRSCDTYGIRYMDKFFLEEFKDDNYKKNRENIYLIQVNCLKTNKSCFCSSLKLGGPFATLGEDIEVTIIKSGYLFESHTKKGDKLIKLSLKYFDKIKNFEKIIEEKKSLLNKSLKTFKTKISFKNINKILEQTFLSNIWKDISKGCIECTGCTNVCPTCTCFNVVEENKNKNSGTRFRYWDSCQNLSFTLNAGNHNTRDIISKTRFRIYDKLKYIEERFGYKGCTGCGRCIDVCPTNINIIKIIKSLYKDFKKNNVSKKINKINSFKYKIYNKKNIDNSKKLYVPDIATIVNIINESKNIKRFKIQYDNLKFHDNYKYHGQFFEITIFGIGEIAISIPFGENETQILDFVVKKVGKVTTAMHNLKIGDKIGLRGPYGNTFPYKRIEKKDILIIGSGVGLAPVRAIVSQIILNRKNFKKIIIIISGSDYESIIYKKDFKKWSKLYNIKVIYALAKNTNKIKCYVGYANDVIQNIDFNWNKASSIICASPKRIKLIANDLISLGVYSKNIFVIIETHMRCGVGKCGHCKVGSNYICLDGPIIDYSQMIKLPPEY